jgi:hypothetical protein
MLFQECKRVFLPKRTYTMKLTGKTSAALQAALLFFIISNPMTYKIVDSLLGFLLGRIAGPSGCPTNTGLIVHTIVFGLVAYALML